MDEKKNQNRVHPKGKHLHPGEQILLTAEQGKQRRTIELLPLKVYSFAWVNAVCISV